MKKSRMCAASCHSPPLPLSTRHGHERDPAHLPILVPLVCTGGQGPTFVAKPEAASSGRLFLCPGFRPLKSPLRTGGLPTQGASDHAQTLSRLRRDLATRDAAPSTPTGGGNSGIGQIRRSAT